MKTITIKASTGNGLDKEFVGEVVRDFPETLDEAKTSWMPVTTNDKGDEVARTAPFTEAECLEMIKRSFVIDTQRTMRPKVVNEKAKQMTALQLIASTNPEVAKMLTDQGITVKPTKENGLLKS
jgi:predicted flap endonuclease-1-like 5' DNA nuclease